MSGRPLCIQAVSAKKVLKANKKVPRVAKGVSDVIAYATELFVVGLFDAATKEGAGDLRPEDLARVIETTPEYDFLLPLLPKLQAAGGRGGDEEAPPGRSRLNRYRVFFVPLRIAGGLSQSWPGTSPRALSESSQ